tara:strand:- start:20 stop:226 length:207 start_codon:yes stop_codon:yes gene_type:complete
VRLRRYTHMACTTVESDDEVTDDLIAELRNKALKTVKHHTKVFKSVSGRVIVQVRISEARDEEESTWV